MNDYKDPLEEEYRNQEFGDPLPRNELVPAEQQEAYVGIWIVGVVFGIALTLMCLVIFGFLS